MPVQTSCADCGKKLRIREELVGKKVKCPGCGTPFVVKAEGNGTLRSASAAKSVESNMPMEKVVAKRTAKKAAPPPADDEDQDQTGSSARVQRKKKQPKPGSSVRILILAGSVVGLLLFVVALDYFFLRMFIFSPSPQSKNVALQGRINSAPAVDPPPNRAKPGIINKKNAVDPKVEKEPLAENSPASQGGPPDASAFALHDLLVSANLPQGYQATAQDIKQGNTVMGHMILVSKPNQASNAIVMIEMRDFSPVPARRAAAKAYVNGSASSLRERGFKVIEKNIPDMVQESFDKPVTVEVVFADASGKKMWMHHEIFFTDKGFDVAVLADNPGMLQTLTTWAKTVRPRTDR